MSINWYWEWVRFWISLIRWNRAKCVRWFNGFIFDFLRNTHDDVCVSIFQSMSCRSIWATKIKGHVSWCLSFSSSIALERTQTHTSTQTQRSSTPCKQRIAVAAWRSETRISHISGMISISSSYITRAAKANCRAYAAKTELQLHTSNNPLSYGFVLIHPIHTVLCVFFSYSFLTFSVTYSLTLLVLVQVFRVYLDIELPLCADSTRCLTSSSSIN